jgi:hypothetical protein
VTSATATNANANGCVVIEYRAVTSMKQIVSGTYTIGTSSMNSRMPLRRAMTMPATSNVRYTTEMICPTR